MSKFRDHLWLWGQNVMSHQMASWPNSRRKIYRNSGCIPDGNLMDPATGAHELNIPNVFRLVMSGKPVPPFDKETRKLADMSQVVLYHRCRQSRNRMGKELDRGTPR